MGVEPEVAAEPEPGEAVAAAAEPEAAVAAAMEAEVAVAVERAAAVAAAVEPEVAVPAAVERAVTAPWSLSICSARSAPLQAIRSVTLAVRSEPSLRNCQTRRCWAATLRPQRISARW